MMNLTMTMMTTVTIRIRFDSSTICLLHDVSLITSAPKAEVGESCSTDENCRDSNARCTQSVCTCKQSFILDDKSCGELIVLYCIFVY